MTATPPALKVHALAPAAPLAVLRFRPAALADTVLLTADNVGIHVHGAILAQGCRFFERLFEDVGTASGSGGGNREGLRVEESWVQLRPLLRFLYRDPPEPAGGDAVEKGAGAGREQSGGWAWGGTADLTAAELGCALEMARKYDCPELLASCDGLLSSEAFKLTEGVSSTGAGCGDLFTCLVLARTYQLDKATDRCWRHFQARLPDMAAALRSGAPARAAAVSALAQLAPDVAAQLLVDVMHLAAEQARNSKYQEELSETCSERLERLTRECTAYSRAIDQHVRGFEHASRIRGAIHAAVQSARR